MEWPCKIGLHSWYQPNLYDFQYSCLTRFCRNCLLVKSWSEKGWVTQEIADRTRDGMLNGWEHVLRKEGYDI